MVFLLVISLLALLFASSSMPIAYALGLSALLSAYIFIDLPIFLLAQKMVSGVNSFTLLAIPFFMLAANLMNEGGITTRILSVFNGIFGAFRGALGLASVGANMLLAGISGSAVADATATGSVLIPAMRKSEYPPAFAAAICAVAAICGPIIPPSIPMVIYGVVARVSIIELFVAGYIPGLMLGFSLLAYVWVVSRIRNFPADGKVSLREIGSRIRHAALGLVMPVILIVGIFGGVFTITELGAVLVIYALLVAMLAYRTLNLKGLGSCLTSAALDTANVMFIIGISGFFAYLLVIEGVPNLVADYLQAHITNPIIVLLVFNLVFLIAGMFLDSTPATIILVPILLPIAVEFGVDPVHFGMIAVFNLMIGLVTPPVAMTLYISARIAEVPISRAIVETIPMFALLLVVLGLITFVPELTLWLPRTLGY
ncbi:MAG: TRAP transporter large permease [Sulfitobacter dubius]